MRISELLSNIYTDTRGCYPLEGGNQDKASQDLGRHYSPFLLYTLSF